MPTERRLNRREEITFMIILKRSPWLSLLSNYFKMCEKSLQNMQSLYSAYHRDPNTSSLSTAHQPLLMCFLPSSPTSHTWFSAICGGPQHVFDNGKRQQLWRIKGKKENYINHYDFSFVLLLLPSWLGIRFCSLKNAGVGQRLELANCFISVGTWAQWIMLNWRVACMAALKNKTLMSIYPWKANNAASTLLEGI